MDIIRAQIEKSTYEMKLENEKLSSSLTKKVYLTDYAPKKVGDIEVWTEAFQCAVNDGEIIVIPESDKIYYIDGTVVIPSNRRIEAYGAHIKQTDGTDVIMLRNSNTSDGTHKPLTDKNGNTNISVMGGFWEECCTERLGYGKSGKYDSSRSFFGVSTLFFFNHMNCLTVKDVTFCHAGGFCVQTGDIENAVFENIRFKECFADGIHINGNTENVYIRDVKGYVGDDLVALNMYDWQNSSVDFGPMRNVWCEDLELSEDSPYKAMRIEPGIYTFDNGSEIDCSAENIVVRNVKGIQTYKMYFQTPSYHLDETPERGKVGSGKNLYFENIDVDLVAPIDGFDNYMSGDPVTGSFAAFELGSNIESITFDGIDLKVDKERFPMAFLTCVGPKSAINGQGKEAFDPYLNCNVDQITLRNIKVNGKPLDDYRSFVHEIVFDHIYPQCPLVTSGKIGKIINE